MGRSNPTFICKHQASEQIWGLPPYNHKPVYPVHVNVAKYFLLLFLTFLFFIVHYRVEDYVLPTKIWSVLLLTVESVLSPQIYNCVFFPHLHLSMYCICVFTTHCTCCFCTVCVCMCICISCVYLSHRLTLNIFCSGVNNPSIGGGNIFCISYLLWVFNLSLWYLVSTLCSMKSLIP